MFFMGPGSDDGAGKISMRNAHDFLLLLGEKAGMRAN